MSVNLKLAAFLTMNCFFSRIILAVIQIPTPDRPTLLVSWWEISVDKFHLINDTHYWEA